MWRDAEASACTVRGDAAGRGGAAGRVAAGCAAFGTSRSLDISASWRFHQRFSSQSSLPERAGAAGAGLEDTVVFFGAGGADAAAGLAARARFISSISRFHQRFSSQSLPALGFAAGAGSVSAPPLPFFHSANSRCQMRSVS
jgi:hypothetical protein